MCKILAIEDSIYVYEHIIKFNASCSIEFISIPSKLRSRHLISISLDEHGNMKQPFLITCFFNWFIFSSTLWSLPRIHQNEILLSGGCVFSSVRNDCSITCSSRMWLLWVLVIAVHSYITFNWYSFDQCRSVYVEWCCSYWNL